MRFTLIFIYKIIYIYLLEIWVKTSIFDSSI